MKAGDLNETLEQIVYDQYSATLGNIWCDLATWVNYTSGVEIEEDVIKHIFTCNHKDIPRFLNKAGFFMDVCEMRMAHKEYDLKEVFANTFDGPESLMYENMRSTSTLDFVSYFVASGMILSTLVRLLAVMGKTEEARVCSAWYSIANQHWEWNDE